MKSSKILFKKVGRNWYLSLISLTVSLIIACLYISGYYQFDKQFLSNSGNEGYFTITKSLGLGNTLSGATSKFNEAELTEIKNQEFYIRHSFIEKPGFNCFAGFFEGQGFKSEIILESLPKDFIDNAGFRFYWDEDQDFVPIIISSEFIRLYNFVYAPISGFPPVQSDALALVPVNLILSGKGMRQNFKAEIIGTTDRHIGIFVPSEFMAWANSKFARASGRKDKMIVKVNPEFVSEFKDYINSKGWDINNENLRMASYSGLIYPLVFAILIILTGLIFLSLSNFWLQWRLLLERQISKIKMMYSLGINPKSLSYEIYFRICKILSFVLGLTLLSASAFWILISNWLDSKLQINSPSFPVEGLIFVLGIMFIGYVTLFIVIKNFCLKSYR